MNGSNPLQSALGKNDFAALAEQHLKHDLRQSDRDALTVASKTAITHASVGSLAGLGLGLLLAWRSRDRRWRAFNSLRTHEQPQSVKLASGQEVPLPDLTPLLRPTPIGGIVSFLFWGTLGTYCGGLVGVSTGALRAKQQIAADPASRDRISVALCRFRADALRMQADALDKAVAGGGDKELF